MTSKEALQEMLGLTTTHYDYWLKANDYYELIKQDLDRLEKLKKAIDILKDKLRLSLNDSKAFKTINAILPVGNNDMNRLTQQEYELLKEVLGND